MERLDVYVDDCVSHAISYVLLNRLPALLKADHLDRFGMPLHDAIGVNCEMSATTDIKAQVISIYCLCMGCMLDNSACVI